MKKNVAIMVIALSFTFTLMGQQKFTSNETDSVFVFKSIDEMAETTRLEASEVLRLDLDDKGFVISSALERDNLVVISYGTKGCNEKDKIIILFESGEKENITSWNKFNCDGTGYYRLNKKVLKLLRNTPIKTIRVTNGITHEAITVEVPENLTRYFIQLYKSYDSGIFKEYIE